MVDPVSVVGILGASYAYFLLAEDILRHGKGAAKLGREVVWNTMDYLVPESDDYLLSQTDEEYLESLRNSIPDVPEDEAIRIAEENIDRTMSMFRSFATTYCDVCKIAEEIGLGLGDVMDGVYTEESLWHCIEFYVSEGIYHDSSEGMKNYFQYTRPYTTSNMLPDRKDDENEYTPCE